MTNKTIVTMRSTSNEQHYFIVCDTPYNALKTAGQIHRLGSHRYVQVRLRSSIPSLKKYIKLENIGLIVGA